MRLVIRVLGVPVLVIEREPDAEEEPEEEEPVRPVEGYWLGFAPPAGDQRWEPGPDFGGDDEE